MTEEHLLLLPQKDRKRAVIIKATLQHKEKVVEIPARDHRAEVHQDLQHLRAEVHQGLQVAVPDHRLLEAQVRVAAEDHLVKEAAGNRN